MRHPSHCKETRSSLLAQVGQAKYTASLTLPTRDHERQMFPVCQA